MSIYGRRTNEPMCYGEVRPIGIGHGGEGDFEYRSRPASDVMLGARLKCIDVPAGMSLATFLDIQMSSGD